MESVTLVLGSQSNAVILGHCSEFTNGSSRAVPGHYSRAVSMHYLCRFQGSHQELPMQVPGQPPGITYAGSRAISRHYIRGLQGSLWALLMQVTGQSLGITYAGYRAVSGHYFCRLQGSLRAATHYISPHGHSKTWIQHGHGTHCSTHKVSSRTTTYCNFICVAVLQVLLQDRRYRGNKLRLRQLRGDLLHHIFTLENETSIQGPGQKQRLTNLVVTKSLRDASQWCRGNGRDSIIIKRIRLATNHYILIRPFSGHTPRLNRTALVREIVCYSNRVYAQLSTVWRHVFYITLDGCLSTAIALIRDYHRWIFWNFCLADCKNIQPQ